MINLIFPKTCYVCQKEGEYLCNACFKKFIKVDPVNKCHICNKESRIGFVHYDYKELTYLDGVLNLTVYDGLIKKLIYDIKYNYYFSITQSVGKIMADYLKYYTFNSLNSVFTFVPTSKKKLKTRGFNQSYLLAKEVCKNKSLPLKEVLKKTHNTGAQAKLDKFDRAENLRGAFELVLEFEVKEGVQSIVIVDDVFTTGATLNECAKIIKAKFPQVSVFGFVIAKARD